MCRALQARSGRSSCHPLVLLSSSSCPSLVLLSSSGCILFSLSSSPPPLVLLVRWPRWRTLCLPPASSGHVFEPCGSSGRSPLSSCHGRKPRVLLLLFVQVCLSCLSTLWALLSPSYPGLVPCLRRFSYLHRLVWVCFQVAIATVTQRSKFDITIGSSHDIYPVFHRFAHVTQALVFSTVYCLGAVPKQLEALEKYTCIRFQQHWNFRS